MDLEGLNKAKKLAGLSQILSLRGKSSFFLDKIKTNTQSYWEGKGRKARGPKAEEIDFNLQTSFFFFSFPLKQQEEINYKCQTFFFFPSLYKIKSRFYNSVLPWQYLVPPELNFSPFLESWANLCIYFMEMFFLSYVNGLCIYLRICLPSSHSA